MSKSKQAGGQQSTFSFSNCKYNATSCFMLFLPCLPTMTDCTLKLNSNNLFLLHTAHVRYLPQQGEKYCGYNRLSLPGQVKAPFLLKRSISSCMFSLCIKGSMGLLYLHPLTVLLGDDLGPPTLGISIQRTLVSIPGSQRSFPTSFP